MDELHKLSNRLDLPPSGPLCLRSSFRFFVELLFLVCFSLLRVDSVGAEELEDPAVLSEAQQFATEGKEVHWEGGPSPRRFEPKEQRELTRTERV